MNILITGGTGFIGRHLVQDLSNRFPESQIYCTVRPTSKKSFISPFKVNFIHADITDFNSLNRINKDIDIIFHCAGRVRGTKNELFKINALGTKNVCKFAMDLNVDRVVYVSSISVVSGNKVVPLKEDLPYIANNIYGKSKIKAEEFVLKYRKKGLKAVIIRPCMVYGEGEPHVMPRVLLLLKYRLLPLVGDGKNKLHLVYVKNVTDCMIYSIFNNEMLDKTYFIADKEVLSMREVYTTMAHSIDTKPPYQIPSFLTPLLKNIPGIRNKVKSVLKSRVYDISRLLSVGYIPPYHVREALRKSCNSFNI